MRKIFDIQKILISFIICSAIFCSNSLAQDYSAQINEVNRILDSLEQGTDISTEDQVFLTEAMKTVNKIPQNKKTDATKKIQSRYEDYQNYQKLNSMMNDIDNLGVVKSQSVYFLESQISKIKNASADNLSSNMKKIKDRYEASAKFYNEGIIDSKIALELEDIKALKDAMSNSINSSENQRLHAEIQKKTNEINSLKARKISKCDGEDECKPYCKYERVESCTFCSLFALVFNTVSAIGEKAITTFSNSVVRVVVVAFGIWLAIQTLLFVSSVETRDLKDFMQNIIIQGFLVMLVVVILKTGAGNFFNNFIRPVYITGQKAAQQVFTDCLNEADGAESESCKADKKILNSDYPLISREYTNSLSPDMGVSIIKTMTMMENRVRQMKALGSSLMCESWSSENRRFFIFPYFRFLFVGFAFWTLSMLIIICMPFLMIDAVFQLGVAVALLPVAVGCFAFKSTRQYSKKVWETFLNSTFTFLFISVVVLIIIGTLQATVTSLSEVSESLPELKSISGEFSAMFNIDGWVNHGGSQYHAAITENLGVTTQVFIKIVFIFLLAWAVLKMAKSFAGEFASSISSTAIGSSIGTMAASTTKGMALKTAQPMREILGDRMRRGAFRFARGLRRASSGPSYKKQKDKIMQEGKTENGKTTYTDKKGRTHTLENGVITTTETQNGKEVTTIKTENITLVRTKESKIINGKRVDVYNDEIRPNNELLNEVIRDNGSIDTEKMKKLYAGLSGEQRKQVQVAILKAATEKRIGKDAHNYGKSDNVAPPEIVEMNSETGEMVIKEVNAKGEVTFSKMRMHANGHLETSVTKINDKGEVTTYTSDGIHNKISKRKLSPNADIKDINNLKDVENNIDKSKGEKEIWGFSKYYQQSRHRVNGVPDGIYGKEEIKKAHRFISEKGHEFDKAEIDYLFN